MVFILMILSSLAAVEVVRMTTASATSDEKIVDVTTMLLCVLGEELTAVADVDLN